MPKQPSVTERFGIRIRVLCTERGLSQEALAELCGLDRTYISGIERGLRNVALQNIEALAIALGVSLADLFKDI
jgi:transcriptional regulator with XRE-family HTH domain